VRGIIIVHVDLKKNYDDRKDYIEQSFDMILDREFNFVLYQEIQSIFHTRFYSDYGNYYQHFPRNNKRKKR